MELAKYKACICEGSAEEAIIDILVDNDLLIFNREEMLEERVIRCRSAKRFEERYLRKGFDEQISVIRILDSRREEFRLSKAYEQKIDVVNVITAPEIEMLIIHAEGAYDQFKRSGKKPSEFCKTNLRMHDVKSYDFVKQYFSNPQLLVKAIKEYRRTANIPKGECSLSDRALKKPKRTVGSPASGQTNEGGKSSLLHTDRECGIILEKTLYGKDKHDERSGYYETPCRLRQRL